jgi:hypothetical protein
MIARITSNTTHVSICTPPCYKHLFLLLKLCTTEGKPLLHCGWMNILAQLSSKHTAHHRIHYTQNYVVSLGICVQKECSLQFIACLVLLMQTEHLCNDIYYLTMHVILKVWVKLVDSLLSHTIHILPKWDTHVHIVHTTTHLIHITVRISQKIVYHHWHLLCHSLLTLLMTTYPECNQ